MTDAATDTATLAILGGTPVRRALLPYGRQSIDDSDIAAVVDVLRGDWITTGPKVDEFEDAFARYVGAAHAVAFSSGTAALHGAAAAAGLSPGGEAITTPLTFCATANSVLYQGASPVFADVTATTLNLDPAAVAERITPRTKALIPVDYAGNPADLSSFRELADRHGLVLIEDAAQAVGAEYDGRRVGSIADMTVFSFHPVKHLTTGEGGMVTTDDPKLARVLRSFRNHGIDSSARVRHDTGQWFYEMTMLGNNYRLTDIASALGLSQLARMDANLARRREIAALYLEAFGDLPLILPGVESNVLPAWHLFPVRLRLEELTASRADVYAALRAEGLGVNVHHIPVHFHPYYRELMGDLRGTYPVAEDAYERLISLPMYHAMTAEDVGDVVSAVRKVLVYYRVTT